MPDAVLQITRRFPQVNDSDCESENSIVSSSPSFCERECVCVCVCFIHVVMKFCLGVICSLFNKYVYVHVLRSMLLILCFNAKFFYRTIIIFYFVLKTEVSTLMTKFGALEANLIPLRTQIGKNRCKLTDKLLLNFKHTDASTHARPRAHTHTHTRARAQRQRQTQRQKQTQRQTQNLVAS